MEPCEDMIIGNGFHPPPRILDRTFPLVNISLLYSVVQKSTGSIIGRNSVISFDHAAPSPSCATREHKSRHLLILNDVLRIELACCYVRTYQVSFGLYLFVGLRHPFSNKRMRSGKKIAATFEANPGLPRIIIEYSKQSPLLE